MTGSRTQDPRARSLSDAERAEIDEELGKYEDAGAASVEALHTVQKHRGWISDEALKAVAGYTGVPAAALEGVATFHNLLFRQPVGRHVVLVCDSVSCWICGYDDLRARLTDKLGIGYGETDADDRFTLLPSVCLGNCDNAPAMMIDGDHYGRPDDDELDRILADYE
ncbi:MAG: NADH-quinone oxidoreductase subunit NuoE [Candidatus Wenzhouxiangella sp. M2_3B_020]